jgi:uncharacterized phage protein (TIGR01671 family)
MKNQREIEFRAWDKINKRMVNVDGFSGLEKDDSREFKYITCSQGVIDWKDIILMQFTGLLDKNGKKIFEGDIVRTDSFYSQKLKNYIVRWDKYAAWHDLRCIEDKDDVEFLGTGVQNVTLYSSSEYNREVIGNIFENPDFLN